MKVLFTTPILEHPPAGGPQLRIENSIKALARVCDLDIVHRAYKPSADIEATDAFYRQYAKEYTTVYTKPAGVPSSWLRRQFSRVIDRLFKPALDREADALVEHAERRNIDVVWFGYGNISYPLIKRIKTRKPELKVVCDTDSVWSRFVLRELPYAKGLRKLRIMRAGLKKRAEEKAWVSLCDVTAAVSEVDAEYYRSLTKDAGKVRVFSNVIDLASYVDTFAVPPGFKNPSIYLAGTFGHYNSPMDMAARWVLEEIFPVVLRARPDLHFYIVGRDSDKGFGHLNGSNITVTGRLESVLPYLTNTSIALVPLKFESGTRFKILEAGACNIPLVSTTLGAEGIPVKNGEHILIADEPQDFAQAIIRLLDDRTLAKQLAQNCHDLVSRLFSVEALSEEAKNILEYLSHD